MGGQLVTVMTLVMTMALTARGAVNSLITGTTFDFSQVGQVS